MKFCTISDLHIRKAGDIPSKLLEKFLASEQVNESHSVYFLGDIFDFMVGNRNEYLSKYKFFFDSILKLISKGKKVYYIEGNHDFHLEKIMLTFQKENNLNSSQFMHFKNSFVKIDNGKKFFFSHGHEIDNNKSYQNWKNIYSSKAFKVFVDHILPFSFVEKMGIKASNDSKKRGVKDFIYKKSKEKYRHGAGILIKKESIDFLIAGHTHILENLTLEQSIYANNGFVQNTKKFIYFNGTNIELIDLS